MTSLRMAGQARPRAHVRLFGHQIGIDDEAFYCSAACAAADGRFPGCPAEPFRGEPTMQPEFCENPGCGMPVGNPRSAAGWRRVRAMVRRRRGWQGDALADVYGLEAERLRALPGLGLVVAHLERRAA